MTEIRDGLARRVSAKAVPPAVEMSVVGGRDGGAGEVVGSASVPLVDFALLPGSPEDWSHARLATGAYANPWPGRVTVTDEASAATFGWLGAAATLGELSAPLVAGAIFTWDDINALEVTLYGGHLSSRDETEVLAGANLIAVETDAGEWEVVEFANAELVAPGQYRLTHLLRGRWGTDVALGAADAGNRVLLLDGRAMLLTVPAAWLDTTVALRSYAGAADVDGTPASVEIGLDPVLPLPLVHLTALRVGGSDIAFSWIRRSRADADSWAGDDAPLDFVPEAYRLTILSGGTPVRTIDSIAAAATYTSAQQTADFGAPPSSFDYSVAQLSAVYGAGHAATATFTA